MNDSQHAPSPLSPSRSAEPVTPEPATTEPATTEASSSGPGTRRDFLRQAAAISAATGLSATFGAPTIVSAQAVGGSGTTAASERITLGVIGIGPRCTYDLSSILKLADVQCVAIADVQASRRDAGKKLVDDHYGNADCRLFRDFRELLARDDIDAVLIATGDRWHAPASLLAMQAGKDVYSEKPCGITIELCQQLAQMAHETGRVFQAGTQRRSVPNFTQAVELAHSGKLGKLQTLYASVYIPTLDNSWLPGEPSPGRDVVDWNMWLGTAPWRPYNSKYVSGGWRGYYDFDSGARLLDWGAHTVDLCQWANQADDTLPISYEPRAEDITCTYANGVTLIIDFVANPFGDRGPRWNTKLGTCPVRFVGDEGSVETGDSGETDAKPPRLATQLQEAARRVQGLDVSLHARNFFDCVKTRALPAANANVMRNSHVACHAAAIAWMLQRKLTIDPATQEFVDDPEANSLRARPARDWASFS